MKWNNTPHIYTSKASKQTNKHTHIHIYKETNVKKKQSRKGNNYERGKSMKHKQHYVTSAAWTENEKEHWLNRILLLKQAEKCNNNQNKHLINSWMFYKQQQKKLYKVTQIPKQTKSNVVFFTVCFIIIRRSLSPSSPHSLRNFVIAIVSKTYTYRHTHLYIFALWQSWWKS